MIHGLVRLLDWRSIFLTKQSRWMVFAITPWLQIFYGWNWMLWKWTKCGFSSRRCNGSVANKVHRTQYFRKWDINTRIFFCEMRTMDVSSHVLNSFDREISPPTTVWAHRSDIVGLHSMRKLEKKVVRQQANNHSSAKGISSFGTLMT